MEWKKPQCFYCKKEIAKPTEAIYNRTIVSDHFYHVKCFAAEIRKTVPVGKMLALGAFSGGILQGGLAYRGVQNVAKDAMEENRAGLQSGITSTGLAQLIFGSIFTALFAFAIIYSGKIKFDVFGWLAVLILGTIGMLMLAATLIYHIKLREFGRLK